MKHKYLYGLYVLDNEYHYFHFMHFYHSRQAAHNFIKREVDKWATAERYFCYYAISRELPTFNASDRPDLSNQYLYDSRYHSRDKLIIPIYKEVDIDEV